MIRTYLDWMTSLPWNHSTEGEIDVAKARQVLDEDHYDLEKIKERILEYLAVRQAEAGSGRAAASPEGAEPRADSLLRRPARCRQDEPGAVDRARRWGAN